MSTLHSEASAPAFGRLLKKCLQPDDYVLLAHLFEEISVLALHHLIPEPPARHWYERTVVRGTLAGGGLIGFFWTSYQIAKTDPIRAFLELVARLFR